VEKSRPNLAARRAFALGSGHPVSEKILTDLGKAKAGKSTAAPIATPARSAAYQILELFDVVLLIRDDAFDQIADRNDAHELPVLEDR
jgi:hypothetical protein